MFPKVQTPRTVFPYTSPLAIYRDSFSLRFGKVTGPAPESFLNKYTKITTQDFEVMEQQLRERIAKNISLSEAKKQIPVTRDDAPGLEIAEIGQPYGKGLIATKSFKKGDVVIHLGAKDAETGSPAFYLSELKDIHASDPVMALSHYILVGDHLGLTWPKPQKISYLNHAKESEGANVEMSYAKHGYVAITDIKKGEKVFSDYATGEYQTAEDDKVFDERHPFVLQ